MRVLNNASSIGTETEETVKRRHGWLGLVSQTRLSHMVPYGGEKKL